MALFSRLFSPKKSNKKQKPIRSSSQSPIKESKPFAYSLDKNEVRVLLFRECDWRGRKLLFDSTSVEKVPLDPKTPGTRPRSNSTDMIVEISKGYGYKYKKPHADINNLGETIFGSVAMATRGPSTKIHQMKDPGRIMFTKVIQAPRSGVRRRQISDEKTLDDSQGSSMNSMGEYNSGSFGSKQGSFDATLDDSGFGGGREMSIGQSSDWLTPYSPQPSSCSSHCPLHPPSLPCNLEDGDQANSSSSLQSGSSLSSLRRRWARSVLTTLDFTDTTQPQPSSGKRTKLGIALIVPLMPSVAQEMEQFLLDRLPLIQNILTRLQHSTERAYCRRDVFVHSMFQASIHAVQSVFELLCGSRLDKPLWLTMTSEKTKSEAKTELAEKLVADLSHLLVTLDTKHTNFFISTLLTAVLTHHLGWVPTVFTDMPTHSNNPLADLSKSHPYNPLWAQLSDLQGSLGYPPKIAKTVVVGKSEVLVHKLLTILSYFIRCGHVNAMNAEREVHPNEETNLEQLLDPQQEKSVFDKDAIREFSKASIGTSSSTLTKSKTVLSMKTFSVTDCDMDNANSLESGFESCNEFSGESYEDGNKTKPFQSLAKLVKSRSCAKLMETSFSQCAINDSHVEDANKMIITTPTISPSLSVVKLVETDRKDILKIEQEKQFTSANILKKISSKQSLIDDKSRHNSFIKENVVPPEEVVETTEEKGSKVVFVLGENEELVNIKGQDEANIPKDLVEPVGNETDFEVPIILIENVDEDNPDLKRERSETENQTDFVTGDINSRVVIVRSTPIDINGAEDSRCLKSNQLYRCLSVPEEAVSETDWVKSKRSKEAALLIRRWLSDSAIGGNLQKPLGEFNGNENLVNLSKINSAPPASVFRTSNRSLEETVRSVDESVDHILNKIGCEVPSVEVVDVDMEPPQLVDEFITLPCPSSLEASEPSKMEVGVAASLFGGVAEVYCPELVLQGVTQSPFLWAADLRHSLLLEAHNDTESDLAEAVCILANTDTWEVTLMSSHSHRGDQSSSSGSGIGCRVGMSQLVANMLETTHHLCGLSLPAHVCLSHVETKLREFCTRSQALAELLLNCDFLDMASLTSTLDLDANDVPLLLSVASTHTPAVTRKYGLSFQ